MLLRFPVVVVFFWLLLLCISLISRSTASLLSRDLLGISPQDEKYYSGLSSGAVVRCKNGSNKFTGAQLNDDFCDCPDGSDEPGTSACPNGKFYCRNAGHTPLLIYSSRVNDGICDCCDGSDEYGGKTKCPNMCWEAGTEARDKLKKKIAIYQEGVTIRNREVEKAKLAILKEEEELVKLTKEEKILKGIVEQLKVHKEQIEKAEEKERLQRENDEKEKKEAEEAKLEETKTEEKYHEEAVDVKDGIHEEIPSEEDPLIENVVEDHSSKVDKAFNSDTSKMDEAAGDEADTVAEDSLKHDVIEDLSAKDDEADLRSDSEVKDATENTESLTREELGRVVGSRWTGKKTEKETGDAEANKDYHGDHDEEYNTYDSDDDTEDQMDDIGGEDHDSSSSPLLSDDDTEVQGDDFGGEDHDSSSSSSLSDDELDLSDITSTSNPHWLEKIKRNAQRIFQTFNLFQTPVDISEAARVRKEYDDSSAKLSKIQSRISKLTKKLKHDFGPEKEFYSFHGQCFERKKNKYTYKICPFKKATQVEDYSTSNLGNWDKFEDSYRTMIFANGDNCWNGPDRSIKVKLRCGLKNEVIDVDEPSRCEYLAFLSTPALCVEEKLKELEDKLKTLNNELSQGHDEL